MSFSLILGAMLAPATPAAPATGHKIIYSDIERVRQIQQEVGFAESVTAGDTVYVSGVIASTAPADKALEDAYGRAFDRLTAILERAGVGWADVVEIRSYHTDPSAQLDAMAKVKRRYRAAPDPAWTAVGTSALLSPTGITEIAITAKVPASGARGQ